MKGSHLESRVFSTMSEQLEISKTHTTSLHPQNDRLTECFNRTLAEQLSILTSTHEHDWDTHLPLVLIACHTAVQDPTSCLPGLLMLGREIRTPAELGVRLQMLRLFLWGPNMLDSSRTAWIQPTCMPGDS